jgi:hypothetical protein
MFSDMWIKVGIQWEPQLMFCYTVINIKLGFMTMYLSATPSQRFFSKSKLCYNTRVVTLALDLRPRQRLARLRAKREAWESHHMFPGVQRMWGNEPSHSQLNSHCGSWSSKWTLKSSKRNYRGQNPLVQRMFYIIGNILKLRCLKWACMTHLDIWNTSYDQKKGWESNW